jgi:hypothetical protein
MTDQTPIERIRGQVQMIREQHFAGLRGRCVLDGIAAPCPLVMLASDKLKLAEALEKLGQLDPYPCECDDHTSEHCCVAVEWFCGQCWSARFLAEVSR